MAATDYSQNSLGRVVQVIGPVVDVAFDVAELPEINPDLKYQLLVVLDEFTAVGRIPIMLNSIAFVPEDTPYVSLSLLNTPEVGYLWLQS